MGQRKEYKHKLKGSKTLKVVSATFLLVFCMAKIECFEIRKNVFYFTSKALFVLEIIRF